MFIAAGNLELIILLVQFQPFMLSFPPKLDLSLSLSSCRRQMQNINANCLGAELHSKSIKLAYYLIHFHCVSILQKMLCGLAGCLSGTLQPS